MAGPQQTSWAKLKCDSCGSIYFYEKLHLNFKDGGGTNKEHAGYACRQCNADVDIAKMISRLSYDKKREELRQLQEELGTAPPPPKKAPHDTLTVADRASVTLKEG